MALAQSERSKKVVVLTDVWEAQYLGLRGALNFTRIPLPHFSLPRPPRRGCGGHKCPPLLSLQMPLPKDSPDTMDPTETHIVGKDPWREGVPYSH